MSVTYRRNIWIRSITDVSFGVQPTGTPVLERGVGLVLVDSRSARLAGTPPCPYYSKPVNFILDIHRSFREIVSRNSVSRVFVGFPSSQQQMDSSSTRALHLDFFIFTNFFVFIRNLYYISGVQSQDCDQVLGAIENFKPLGFLDPSFPHPLAELFHFGKKFECDELH